MAVTWEPLVRSISNLEKAHLRGPGNIPGKFQYSWQLMSEVAQNPRHTSANPSLSEEVHLHIPSILGLSDTRAGCDTLLLLMLVVTSVVARERRSKPPCPSTADTRGCQLTFRCTLSHTEAGYVSTSPTEQATMRQLMQMFQSG